MAYPFQLWFTETVILSMGVGRNARVLGKIHIPTDGEIASRWVVSESSIFPLPLFNKGTSNQSLSWESFKLINNRTASESAQVSPEASNVSNWLNLGGGEGKNYLRAGQTAWTKILILFPNNCHWPSDNFTICKKGAVIDHTS